MTGESRKWIILVASTWIQAFTGTNFDFSSYSSDLKSVLAISQVELNYLSMASDMGKAFGWLSGVCLIYFPLWTVLLMAALMGAVGYGLQWLVLQQVISLPYVVVFVMCLLAGCSISWFNTVCYVLCIETFPSNKSLALSLSISYNGISAALYNLIVDAIGYNDGSIYLFLNGLVPLLISVIALVLILQAPAPPQDYPVDDDTRVDSIIFLFLNLLAIITGVYLLLPNSISSDASIARILLCGAAILLLLPLGTYSIVHAWEWNSTITQSIFQQGGSNLKLVNDSDLELHIELVGNKVSNRYRLLRDDFDNSKEKEQHCDALWEKYKMTALAEEHSVKMLLHRLDFWLYYIAYLCGGTIGIAYSNNLGQISQSLGYGLQTNDFVTVYSACSFFGRLLSAFPNILPRINMHLARTGWFTLALVPTACAFFLLAISDSKTTLTVATGLIGLSSGFIFSLAVSITSELFGAKSAAVNHNLLITNIPLGSLIYGLLAALVYDSNLERSELALPTERSMVCMGLKCYFQTFISWGSICLFGLVASSLLFLRTRAAYDSADRNRK